MKIAVAGASGLIGTALTEYLTKQGHEIIKFRRFNGEFTSSKPGEVNWDPARNDIDAEALFDVDAVINLAGSPIGEKRWNSKVKHEILQSRIDATDTIVQALNGTKTYYDVARLPKILINASAIGIYGDRADELLNEHSAPGEGFLVDVVKEWESSALALSGDVRVVTIRTGLVMHKAGGAFKKMLPLFKLGLGGKLGSGKQFWPAISLRDEIRAIEFLLHSNLRGPVNLVAPFTATNAEFTAALGKQLRRPTILPVPKFALRIVIGEFASDILASTRIQPLALQNAGFVWEDATLESLVAEATR
jgi:uncharacterized protein (TIGR01777 family)